MNWQFLAPLALTLGLCTPARAAFIAVDLDPSTPAVVDASLSVVTGEVFPVSVVVFEDSAMSLSFDTVLLEVFFDDMGPVLALGSTGALAGELAGNSPFTLDLFALGAATPGAPLAVGPASTVLPGDFTAQSGAIALVDPFGFMAATTPVSVFTLEFVALAPGSSTITALGTPPGASALALAGLAVDAASRAGVVQVTNPSQLVPAPAPLLPVAVGVLLAMGAAPMGRRAFTAREG